MKKYVDKDKLQEFATKLHNKQKTIFATQESIAPLVGSPLVASTVAEMTDTTKIYVYVGSESGYTSGNWYYYNGSVWTSGGVYNSTAFETDKTLSIGGMAADAKAAGDAIWELRNDYNTEIKIDRCFLNAKRALNAGVIEENSKRCLSIMFKFPTNIYMKSTNYTFTVFMFEDEDDLSSYDWLGYHNEFYIPAYTPFMYCINSGSADFSADMVDDIKLFTNYAGKVFFDENYYIKINNSRSLALPDHTDNIVERGSVFASQGLNGFRLNSIYYTYYWRTPKPLICDKPITLMCGNYNNLHIALRYLFTDDFIMVYGNQTVTVPANTPFCLVLFSTNEDTSNWLASHAFLIVENSPFNELVETRMVSTHTTRTDCAFIANGKDFLIDRVNKTYTVYDGNQVVKSDISLGGEVGHANSCNYVNGKVYISGWTDNNIYVYTVDTENNSLTYSETIEIPTGGDTFVLAADERQILLLKWGAAYEQLTNYEDNYLRLILLYYQSGEYKIGWEKDLPAIYELQGMTYQDGCIYCIDNNIPYLHRCIIKIDCGTGEMIKGKSERAALQALESEAIYPIGREIFKVVCVDGSTWLCSFIPD